MESVNTVIENKIYTYRIIVKKKIKNMVNVT